MTDGLDWIFFDLGSTLIDESAAAELRIREAAKRSGVPYDECFAKTAEYFAHGKSGYAELAKELHIQLPHWHSEADGSIQTRRTVYAAFLRGTKSGLSQTKMQECADDSHNSAFCAISMLLHLLRKRAQQNPTEGFSTSR